MKHQWLKGTHENTTYYYLASDPYVHEIVAKDDLTGESILNYIERKGHPNRDWGKFIDVVFPRGKSEKNKAIDETVPLPAGVYRLKPNDGLPMRLEEMSVREEGYIPIEDNDSLSTDIDRFLGAKKLYEKLQFIYRRGYLFYGEPGTGKTAYIRYLAQQSYFQDAHRIWIDFVPPVHFVQALNETNSIKVIVMEELLSESGRLSFEMSQLLQFMDGENAIKDCITIATTNYPQFLHKNLADRPSRFDVLYEMKTQPFKIVKKIMETWLEREIKDNELTFSDYSLASLKEIVLLHKFYGISLKDAAKKLKDQSAKFERGFEKVKTFGFGLDKDDETGEYEDD